MARIRSFWRDPEFYFSVLILAFIVHVLVSCPSLSSKGRLIPLIVAIGSLPLILLNVLACIFPLLKDAVKGLQSVELFTPEPGESEKKEKEHPPFKEVLSVFLWFIAAYVIFLFAGYLPMVLSFSFFFLKFRIHFTWAKSALMAGCFSVCTWAVFTRVLGLEPFGIRYYY
ncbi:MAG: tripartite tricarboxylate transporter TctB family protein [Desulfobacterales bacterium]|nr:tripartite tricarboxylate transporter TctB family protein [Desulfobacterales bacterium]